MPLFEFRCRECAHLEEVLQKYTDPPPAVCPACGKEHSMDKEVSLTSFQLKGGGWYKDLYSSTPKDGKKSEGGAKDAGSASSSSSGEKSEKSEKKAAGESKATEKPKAEKSSSTAAKAA